MKLTIKAAPFGAALTNVLPHTCDDNTLPILTAVRMTVDETGTVVFDATDRYSIGEQTIPFDPKRTADGFDPGSVLIPRAFAAELIKQAKTAKLGFVDIHVADGRITVSHPDGSLTALALDGEFPRVSTLWENAAQFGKVGRIGMGAWQVAKLSKVMDLDFRPVRKPTLEINYQAENKPATVVISGLEHFRALLMPVRLNDVAAA